MLWLKDQRFAELAEEWDSGLNRVPRQVARKMLGLGDGVPQEPPEILPLYYKIEKWGAWCDGGYEAQPHYLQRELETCHSAVQHFHNKELARIMEMHNAKVNTDGSRQSQRAFLPGIRPGKSAKIQNPA